MEDINKRINDYISSGKYKDVNLFIATPCYGGMVHESYLKSCCQMAKVFDKIGLKHTIVTISSESLITRARNFLVSKFLANKEFTHIMFIDADIHFDPAMIIRFLEFDKPLIGGCYPKKGINWEKVKHIVSQNENIKPNEIEEKSLDYAINFVGDDNTKQVKFSIENGFSRVSDTSTGFMLIKRECAEKVTEKFPETYVNDIKGYESPELKTYYTLFDTLIHPVTKRYLSEDYAFCYKWRKCGGETWIDVVSPLYHSGTYTFKGNIHSSIKDMVMP